MGEIAHTWQKNAAELDRKLYGLYNEEMAELEPYAKQIDESLYQVQKITENTAKTALEGPLLEFLTGNF